MSQPFDAAYCFSLDQRDQFQSNNFSLGYDIVKEFNAVDLSRMLVPSSHSEFRESITRLHTYAAIAEQSLSLGHERVLIVEDECRFQIPASKLLSGFPELTDQTPQWIELSQNVCKQNGPVVQFSKARILSRTLLEALATFVRGNSFPTSVSVHVEQLMMVLCGRNNFQTAELDVGNEPDTGLRLRKTQKKVDHSLSTPEKAGLQRSENHFFQQIHGWFDFQEIYQTVAYRSQPDDIIVEVGSWLGRSAVFLATELKEVRKKPRFVCVDLFNQPNIAKRVPGSTDHLEAFQWQTFPHRDMIEILPEDSSLAAEQFEDESVSFAFIDAEHSYSQAYKDIAAWIPKIKKGGVLAGHDYNWNSVKRAVDELLPSAQRVRNSWVFFNSEYFAKRLNIPEKV